MGAPKPPPLSGCHWLKRLYNNNLLKMIGIESMARYVSPVNPAIYPHLTLVLMSIGIFFTAWFFVYEVTSTKLTRDFFKECLIALVASGFMGFGILFLLLGWGYTCENCFHVQNERKREKPGIIPLMFDKILQYCMIAY